MAGTSSEPEGLSQDRESLLLSVGSSARGAAVVLTLCAAAAVLTSVRVIGGEHFATVAGVALAAGIVSFTYTALRHGQVQVVQLWATLLLAVSALVLGAKGSREASLVGGLLLAGGGAVVTGIAVRQARRSEPRTPMPDEAWLLMMLAFLPCVFLGVAVVVGYVSPASPGTLAILAVSLAPPVGLLPRLTLKAPAVPSAAVMAWALVLLATSTGAALIVGADPIAAVLFALAIALLGIPPVGAGEGALPIAARAPGGSPAHLLFRAWGLLVVYSLGVLVAAAFRM